MTALAAFSAAARGKVHIEQHSILPDSNSPGVTITALYPFQSYFDSALLQNAILVQSANEPIVNNPTTPAQIIQIGGYGLALHPSSQTPLAVQPLVGASGTAAPQAIILRPGQIWRPHGRLDGKQGNFSSFRMGLPFGWLGGGVATLYVLSASDAAVSWQGSSPEILFHRQRMQIIAPVALPANAPKNWPLRFPWTQAQRGATPIPQKGQAILGIGEPTKVLMSLRNATQATADTMRILIQSSNDFDVDSAGAQVSTPVRFVDYVWGSYGANGGAGNLGTNYPLDFAPEMLVRLAADDGGVTLVDMSAGTLTNAFVDICRYGKL